MRQFLIRLIVLMIPFTTLNGCMSYFIRKDCEAKNWYQHGFELAMKGQRISNDDYTQQCRKAEAEISEAQLDQGFKAGMSNYCKPDVVFQTGKNGENLNLDLCDPGQTKFLKARHTEGIRAYCDPQNGYAVGAAGKAYSKVCPDDLEKKFMPEFNRGRKKYLQAMVNETQNKVSDLDRRANDKEREVRNLQVQLAMVPPPQQIINRTVTPNGVVEHKETSDPYQDRRTSISNSVHLQETQLRSLQQQQQTLKDSLYQYQRELQTLE